MNMIIYLALQIILGLIGSIVLWHYLGTHKRSGAPCKMLSAPAETSKSPSNLIDSIEEKTKRKVGIVFDEFEASGKYNEQEASPLFSVLPRELRDHIWAFATAPYEDPNEKFEQTAYYYRPGHAARLKTDTAILLTCRRAWLEANALPMLQAEHSFYYRRPAPDKRDPEWTAKLTAHNRQNFGHLHLFVQMYAIEGLKADRGRLREYFLKTPAAPGDFQPRMLHVTVRHTDWWNWENEAPLHLKDPWVQALLDSPDLRSTQTLRLELETLDYKVDQLAPILERIKAFESAEIETHIIDGKPAKTKFVLTGQPETYTWEGPSNINQQQFDPYADRTTLQYHVVTLTWKLHFPDIPNGFIPRLRRAPRIGSESPRIMNGHRHMFPLAWLGALGGTHTHRPPRNLRLRRGPLTRQRHAEEERAEGERRFCDMHVQARIVQQHSHVRAEAHERYREWRFEEYWEAKEAERWRAKWEDERSLLEFVDWSR